MRLQFIPRCGQLSTFPDQQAVCFQDRNVPMHVFVITFKCMCKRPDVAGTVLTHMAQQIKAARGKRVQHGLYVEKRHMGFINLLTGSCLIPGSRKSLTHVVQAAHIDLNLRCPAHLLPYEFLEVPLKNAYHNLK